MKSGSADLPLHGGHCPSWLFEDMKDLGEVMIEAMILEFDRETVIRRFSDPGWFQAFGCTLGFDWHSSGLTTVVCGALKEVLNPRSDELGLYLAGGKGNTSRKTPDEIATFAESTAPGIAVQKLQDCSRRTAQVDSSAVQDGFDLYHHVFLVDQDENWTVIQQGIRDEDGWARRYHWNDKTAGNFIDDPHEGICSDSHETTLNLANPDSRENRTISVDIATEDPVGTLQEYTRLLDFWDDTSNRIKLPDRHSLPQRDHLDRVLGNLYEKPPESFSDLLDRDGIGTRTVRALSMISEVVWGAEPSYEDPARYSFAHGGKDGYPFPVDRETYEDSVEVLSDAIGRAKVGDETKMKAFERLQTSFLEGNESVTINNMEQGGTQSSKTPSHRKDGSNEKVQKELF